jgi:uracil-DNA glycosylase family 4
MDLAKAARLIRQHAESSRLLGVEFVPVYRRPGAAPLPAQAESSGGLFAEAKPVAAPVAQGVVVGVRDRATAQQELDALRERYEREAPHQHFVTAHHNIVFGEGDCCARLMFIGEAPGEEEDRTGRPFVGRAGQLLNKMIDAMGLKREDVYIANVLKTRPPNNATPTQEEARLCAPFLYEQVRIIGPEAIVTLGLPATRTLLNTMESMGRLRGQWAEFRDPSGRAVPVMPTYHPAFLLRSYTPENRGKVWADLRMVMDRLGGD